MIRNLQFFEFCRNVINKHNEDEEERTLWQYYLHKVYDQSFDDFRIQAKAQTHKTTDSELTDIVKKSRSIVLGFNEMEMVEQKQ